MKSLIIKTALCLVSLNIALSVFAGPIRPQDPLRLPDGQLLKSIYFFGHWWDPWKSDDAILAAELKKIKDLGFNTICVDHEVSQAVDRDWYWLDREYKLAGQEKVYILPWLQLQAVDRQNLMKFSHLQLKPAVNQDKQVEEGCILFQDGEFRKALAHYVSVYLDRYGNDPSLLRVKVGGKLLPVVGLCVETGWRNEQGLPLSFDEETNAYFRKWMRSSYHDLAELNKKWGTNYKSFDEIDPCDKTIFDYAFEDKQNMPMAVREHVTFRARLIADALADVAQRVKKKHKDVLFLAEVAYPFSIDHPDANVFRWNNANLVRIVNFADIVMIRTVGNISSDAVKKEQDLLILDGKKLILAYRFFGDSTPERASAFAVDCAISANGLGYYNWNEMSDSSSAIYDKPDRQGFARLMNFTYDMIYDPSRREAAPSAPITFDTPTPPDNPPKPATESAPAPAEPANPDAPSETAPPPEAPVAPAPITPPAP
ncbi:MAG: beta-galactosidase [Armatimonadetes bacterium]|nr:beta-galactosidase [Armatimonadota bacterium]